MNSKNTNNQIQSGNTNSDNLLIKQFNDLNITIYGTYEEPLFKAKDIGDLLGIKDIRTTLRDFDKDEWHTMPVADSLGRQQETNMLKEQGLYKILMISRKPIAKQFKVWIRNIIKEIRLKGKYDLEEKLKEHQQLLQAKELEHQRTQQELVKYKEKTYEEIEKTGHIYVIKTDAQGAYKVGKTKDAVNKRIRGLQTGNVNNIEILLDFKTSNPDLLEKCAHYILDRYRCNSNREFFDCDINYIKTIVEICGNVIDTLKSTYQHISKDELVEKLKSNGIKIEIEETNEHCQENNPLQQWLADNIVLKEDCVVNLRDICLLFFCKKINNREKTKVRKEIEKWIVRKYPNIDKSCKESRFNGVKYNGWRGLSINGDL